ncbi:MAG: aminoacyl-tRNA hydrolase [Ruminococcaceae bacterium]|nr:aminoacyl-tRNA hydrolase [Oscillospiraceae bacterium]
MLFKKPSGVSWIVVGLGNPGSKYQNTRHNIGFITADYIADEKRVKLNKVKFKASYNILTIGGEKCLLMKPNTYMNLSGDAVKEAATFYKVPADHIIVIFDDCSLPCGKLRIRQNGSAGGHNGIKSIIAQLGTDAFPRIKIGVGEKPHPDYDMADWVLSAFSEQDKKLLKPAVENAAKALEVFISDGPDRAMNKFN